MVVKAFNPDLDSIESTNLSQYHAAAATTLNVLGNQQFTNTDKILIGKPGTENAEIKAVSGAVTVGTTMTVTALTYPHSTDEPVYRLLFDQVKFYRSTTGPTGSYSSLATVTLDYDNPENITTYNDSSGSSSTYYKVSYYNSVSTDESSLSDPIPGSGYNRSTAGAVIDEVLSELGKAEDTELRKQMYFWMNECSDDLITRARKPYNFLHRTVTVDSTAGTSIPYPDDMFAFDFLEYTNQRTTRRYEAVDEPQFRFQTFDTSATNTNDLASIYLNDDDEVIDTWPKFKTTQTGAATIHYWKTFDEINSAGDILETPVPSIYKYYLKFRYYLELSNADQSWQNQSSTWYNQYNIQVGKLRRTMNKNVGKPQSFKGPTRRMRAWRYR